MMMAAPESGFAHTQISLLALQITFVYPLIALAAFGLFFGLARIGLVNRVVSAENMMNEALAYARELVEKAHRHCFIANSVNSELVTEAEVAVV